MKKIKGNVIVEDTGQELFYVDINGDYLHASPQDLADLKQILNEMKEI